MKNKQRFSQALTTYVSRDGHRKVFVTTGSWYTRVAKTRRGSRAAWREARRVGEN